MNYHAFIAAFMLQFMLAGGLLAALAQHMAR
jgi:hypothetical protein